MDTTHLHLLLNHFPIVGTMVAVLFLAYGIFSGSRRTTKASLVIIIGLTLIAIPVFLTGEPAEESVEKLPGVSKSIIEEHEESAEFAIWMMAGFGILSLISLITILQSRELKKALLGFTLLLGLISSGVMARTGYLGGQIRHSEIRSGTPNAAIEGANTTESGEADDD